jgi:NifU-like protein involved in Fe-S cluster formation
MDAPYPSRVWDLFQTAPGAGEFGSGPGIGRGRGGKRRDGGEVEIWLALRGQEVGEARFQAWGCPWTIALAAEVVAGLPGRLAADLAGFRADAEAARLGLPAERLSAKLWIEDAVRNAVRALEEVRDAG